MKPLQQLCHQQKHAVSKLGGESEVTARIEYIQCLRICAILQILNSFFFFLLYPGSMDHVPPMFLMSKL